MEKKLNHLRYKSRVANLQQIDSTKLFFSAYQIISFTQAVWTVEPQLCFSTFFLSRKEDNYS